ncbi:MAG: hypothetical protein IJE24_06960 [Oscillospiraceae bacterium]|nr:hypothetical protein [Oscillospiraceae bacterium]
MHFNDKNSKEIQKENADTKAAETIKKTPAENAAEREQWWEAALYPDPPYVSDR